LFKKPIHTQVAFKIPNPKDLNELTVSDSSMIDMASLLKAPNIGLTDVSGDEPGFINIPEENGRGTLPAIIEEEKEPDINDFTLVAEEPNVLNIENIWEMIVYPEVARENHIQGTVVFRVLIDKEGNYRRHQLIKKSHPMLALAVERHIHKLKFTPAIQGNKPIMFWVNIPFHFKIMD
jgi:protein TonB